MRDKDIIYRQDAYNAVRRNTFRLTFAEEQNGEGHVAWSAEVVYSDVMEGELLELPTAHLKRPKGYMKIKVISAVDGEDLFCENCDAYCLSPSYNFCPKCGVEFIGVRGEQDE